MLFRASSTRFGQGGHGSGRTRRLRTRRHDCVITACRTHTSLPSFTGAESCIMYGIPKLTVKVVVVSQPGLPMLASARLCSVTCTVRPNCLVCRQHSLAFSCHCQHAAVIYQSFVPSGYLSSLESTTMFLKITRPHPCRNRTKHHVNRQPSTSQARDSLEEFGHSATTIRYNCRRRRFPPGFDLRTVA